MNAQANHRHRWPHILLVVSLVLVALYAAYRITLHCMVEANWQH